MNKKIAWGVALALGYVAVPMSASAETKILFNTFAPPKHTINTAIAVPWAEEFARVTDGRVKVEISPTNLAPPPRQFDMVKNKIADMAYQFNAFLLNRVPTVQLSVLPLVSQGPAADAVALTRTYDKFFAGKNEYEGVHLLGFIAATPTVMCSAKDPIVSVESLKALKMWTTPGVGGKALSSLGVTIVPGPAVGVYEIVSRGTVDGISGLSVTDTHRFKIDQFLKSCTKIPGGISTATFSVFISPSKWKEISEKDRAAITAISGESLARRSQRWMEGEPEFEAKFAADGKQLVNASPAFMADLEKAWLPLHDEWIAEANKQGIDGRAALDFYIAQSKAVQKEIEGK